MNPQKSRQQRLRRAKALKLRGMHIAVSTQQATEPVLMAETISHFLDEVVDMPVLRAIGRMAWRAQSLEQENVKLRQELTEAQELIDRWRMKEQPKVSEPRPKEDQRRKGWERRGTKRPYV